MSVYFFLLGTHVKSSLNLNHPRTMNPDISPTHTKCLFTRLKLPVLWRRLGAVGSGTSHKVLVPVIQTERKTDRSSAFVKVRTYHEQEDKKELLSSTLLTLRSQILKSNCTGTSKVHRVWRLCSGGLGSNFHSFTGETDPQINSLR